MQVEIPKGHCSEQFLFRKVFISRLLFRKVIISQGFYSEGSLFWKIVIPKDRYSKRPCFNIMNFRIMAFRNNTLSE